MELRSQTSLLASVLCFALAASVLFRARKRRAHWLFVLFDATVGAWYLTWFLAHGLPEHDILAHSPAASVLERVNLVLAVLLPLAAVQFFRAFLAQGSRRSTQLNRVAIGLAAAMIVAVFTPLYGSLALGLVVVGYVFVVLGAALALLFRGGGRAQSRFEGARLTFLGIVGTVATAFTLAEYLPYVGVAVPPVGTVLMLVFMFVLSQSILKDRLLDLYELAARLLVLTALSFSLAGILWILVFADPGNFYLHSVVAALVMFLVFDPVRHEVEQRIAQIFFRERHDFERMATDLRRHLANVLTKEEMLAAFQHAFESSRRITHGGVWFLDDEHMAFELASHVGPIDKKRVELATARALLERLGADEVVILEAVQRSIEERRELEARTPPELAEIVSILEQLSASVCVAIRDEGEIVGLITVRDERLRDAYAPEELQLLRALGAQASITVQNARLYQRLKERDRLAALGEMSAGLAHEIRNPLGAIKASAQFLAEPGDGAPGASREFLDIIVEEVDRLNRVVSSFLDYARPSSLASTDPIDANATIERTIQLLTPQIGANVECALELGKNLPAVRIDPERLRQVLINLALNAVQAMEGKGKLLVRTVARSSRDAAHPHWVEMHVIDNGPGIPEKIRANLFVPFVTTKERGTGLGLAISQRIVSAAGGVIEARSTPGRGTTFVVRLPAVRPAGEAALTGPRAAFDPSVGSAPGVRESGPPSGGAALPPG
jgi:signal transduction histidine kinase